MKRLLIAFAVALLAMVVLATPVLAGYGNADVQCSDIEVTDDSPPVGTTITFSGTVNITASSENCHNYGFFSGATAGASSNAWFVIIDPNGLIVASGGSSLDDYSEAWWFFDASADASQTYVWSVDIPVDLIGEYTAQQGGEASAFYGHWELRWVCRHLERVYVIEGIDEATGLVERVVTSHGGGLLWRPIYPHLIIQLPSGLVIEQADHAKKFTAKDGWHEVTTEAIAYSDGIWQVEIPAGTAVQLDGKFQKITYIEVDSQGKVIGRYGSDGHIVAEEVGLSQPIVITKVG